MGAPSGPVNRVLLDDMHYRGEQFVHALTIASLVRVRFAIDEEDVQDHGLHPVLVIVGLIGEPLDILSNFCPDDLIAADGVPGGLPSPVSSVRRLGHGEEASAMAHLGVVGQGIDGELGQGFGMVDELEEVASPPSEVLPTEAKDLRQVVSRSVRGQEKSLPADGAATRQTRAGGTAILDGTLQFGEAGATVACRLPS